MHSCLFSWLLPYVIKSCGSGRCCCKNLNVCLCVCVRSFFLWEMGPHNKNLTNNETNTLGTESTLHKNGMADWGQECGADKCVRWMIIGQWRWMKCEHDTLVKGLYVCMIGVFGDEVWAYVRIQACSYFPPGLHVQQMGFSKPIFHIQSNLFLSSPAFLICR